MPGWRVGMLCGSAEHINQVLKFKSNMDSGMFLPVQLAAAKALSLGKEWYDEINAVYRERQKLVFELLEKVECVFNSNQAGLFVWARISNKYENGYLLSDHLLNESSFFITPGGVFGSAGEKYIRVSLCSKSERIREAINRIKHQP
jgi:aspartate/methionine/tyrosine aminotransferase